MEDRSLPLHTAPVDRMRHGFQCLENEMSATHPIMGFEKNYDNMRWTEKITNARRMYGIHMAMRLASEREQFDRSHRLFGLPSSKISLESATGDGISIDYSDFLNDPLKRPDIPKVQLHEVMEVKLGLM
eukprot:CAMPEP_0185024508 /NCGR_PEP_ID=MMETSP1103-20130426/7604_1 /TAXON_ID=36769 /ORGANISM="Paraphysomonas bandaiensis, Strain Caron Lab Isolate" /LENGTH=128 /DNA_ID=CAMNT_0027557493 /DNA_START=52 /DNA_END=438 /DNA_ORIENTATION=+